VETNEVIINRDGNKTELLQWQLSLYETLSKGVGIKGILAAAEHYFNSPAFVCDTSFKFVSFSPTGKELNGYSTGLFYLDAIEIESMKRYNLIETIYSRATAFCSLTPDHPTDHWIFCVIRINKIVSGYLAIYCQEKEPTVDDLTMATVTAQVLSLEMQKHEVFVTKSGLKYEYFLADLLEGQFDDIETVRSRMRILERKLHKYLCILTLSCNNCDPAQFNRTQMEHLRSIYRDSMSLVYKDHIILFISQQTPNLMNDEKKHILLNFLSHNQIKAALSQVFTNPLEARAYFKQSLKSLEIGNIHYPEQLLYFSSEMVLFNLFHNCEFSELKSCIPYQVSELLENDAVHNLDLTLTLKTYLQHNRSASSTAESLHIHRSTLFYRLKKIEELLSISVNDSNVLFLFELSFAIQEYTNSQNIVTSRTHTPS
jgi:sugar diacid utilization regulator